MKGEIKKKNKAKRHDTRQKTTCPERGEIWERWRGGEMSFTDQNIDPFRMSELGSMSVYIKNGKS
jgi:hypothetical protein